MPGRVLSTLSEDLGLLARSQRKGIWCWEERIALYKVFSKQLYFQEVLYRVSSVID